MRTLPLLLPLALASLAGGADAQSHRDTGPWYVQLGGGATSPAKDADIEPESGWAINGLLGYELFGGERFDFALELEGWYSEGDLDTFPVFLGTPPQDMQTLAVMGNGVLDWWMAEDISLYLGAGAGYGRAELFGVDETGLAFQGKVGLRYELGGGFSWNLGYRYVQAPQVEDANDFTGQHHELETGFRWDL